MFNCITHDKIEEVVRLAERAQAVPHRDAAARRSPRGGSNNPPLRPQPAEEWAEALPRFLHDLPVAAVQELVDLYRDAAGSGQTPAPGPGTDPVDYLLGRPDLAKVLRSGYMSR